MVTRPPALVALVAIVAILTLLGATPSAATGQSAELHVTVPSLPGQPNTETKVMPSGALRTDAEGWVVSGPDTGCAGVPMRVVPGVPRQVRRPAPPLATFPSLLPASTSSGRPLSDSGVQTGRNHVTVRGVVSSLDAGRSVTLVLPAGGIVAYALAPHASVAPGLKAGDPVRLQALLGEQGRVTDRVERLATP